MRVDPHELVIEEVEGRIIKQICEELQCSSFHPWDRVQQEGDCIVVVVGEHMLSAPDEDHLVWRCRLNGFFPVSGDIEPTKPGHDRNEGFCHLFTSY